MSSDCFKFKIGDKVKVKNDVDVHAGEIGTVDLIIEDWHFPIQVKFNTADNGDEIEYFEDNELELYEETYYNAIISLPLEELAKVINCPDIVNVEYTESFCESLYGDTCLECKIKFLKNNINDSFKK